MSTGFNPPIGVAEVLAPGLRRIVAPNPSPMTFRGTNTYLLGHTDLAVIDPGPARPAHLAAILGALGAGQRISHIIVTHAHLDHAELVRPLAAQTGAEVLAFGPAEAGRSPMMVRLAALGLHGGEGVDAAFAPDRCIADGETIEGSDWQLQALHTPGHMGNHLCFAWGDQLFSGDHVMGWSTSLVSPPDGDMAAYRAALGTLSGRDWRSFLPGHGAPIPDPAARLAYLAAHRADREAAILHALESGPHGLPGLTAAVYTDTAATLLPAAARNVLAHLIDLEARNLILAAAFPGPHATFRLP